MMNLFSKKNNAHYNLKHPDFKGKTEFAFKCGGTSYYRFIEEVSFPAGRYKWVYAFLREVDMRMSLATTNAYLDELSACLNGKKGKIDVENAIITIHKMRTRLALAFEPESVRRLASVVYFDESEDLSGYNMKHGKAKIERWKKYNTLDFFLTRPIAELLHLKDISLASLEEYIQTTEEIIKELTLEPQSPSPENT